MSQVVVIDYGMGNLKSVHRGLEKVGAEVLISSDPDEIATAERLVLPGVGAFEDGMKGLTESGVLPAIKEFVLTGRPLIGICLGMQMLFSQSDEQGVHQGLGFIPGTVKKIPSHDDAGFRRKIPHIGWSALLFPAGHSDWNRTLLTETKEGDFFYFVHSYMGVPESDTDLIAECEYDEQMIAAVVKKDNITGLQFHPEKSCGPGLRILKQFADS